MRDSLERSEPDAPPPVRSSLRAEHLRKGGSGEPPRSVSSQDRIPEGGEVRSSIESAGGTSTKRTGAWDEPTPTFTIHDLQGLLCNKRFFLPWSKPTKDVATEGSKRAVVRYNHHSAVEDVVTSSSMR